MIFFFNFQIDRISTMAAKYVGKPVVNYSNISPSLPPRTEIGFGNPQGIGTMDMYGTSGDLLRSISGPTEADKPIIIELAVAAMEELIGMAQMGDPLWLSTTPDGAATVLNEDEYVRSFPRGIGPKPNGFKCEASRESSVVIMNHVNLVEILMDVVEHFYIFSLTLLPYSTLFTLMNLSVYILVLNCGCDVIIYITTKL